MQKEKLVYPHKRLLFSDKKDRGVDTQYNIDESQKHYAKSKKPGTKDHRAYNAIQMKCPEKENF